MRKIYKIEYDDRSDFITEDKDEAVKFFMAGNRVVSVFVYDEWEEAFEVVEK